MKEDCNAAMEIAYLEEVLADNPGVVLSVVHHRGEWLLTVLIAGRHPSVDHFMSLTEGLRHASDQVRAWRGGTA